MQKLFRNFMNIFVALTLAAFIVSAAPASVFASNIDADASITHVADSQKDGPVHQKDGDCDDGCCISHCFCAGYAMPTAQTIVVPLIRSLEVSTHRDQTADGISTIPQLRPPRILA